MPASYNKIIVFDFDETIAAYSAPNQEHPIPLSKLTDSIAPNFDNLNYSYGHSMLVYNGFMSSESFQVLRMHSYHIIYPQWFYLYFLTILNDAKCCWCIITNGNYSKQSIVNFILNFLRNFDFEISSLLPYFSDGQRSHIQKNLNPCWGNLFIEIEKKFSFYNIKNQSSHSNCNKVERLKAALDYHFQPYDIFDVDVTIFDDSKIAWDGFESCKKLKSVRSVELVAARHFITEENINYVPQVSLFNSSKNMAIFLQDAEAALNRMAARLGIVAQNTQPQQTHINRPHDGVLPGSNVPPVIPATPLRPRAATFPVAAVRSPGKTPCGIGSRNFIL